jgi:Putative metallopeptidase/Protein of unknown function (DUF1036)
MKTALRIAFLAFAFTWLMLTCPPGFAQSGSDLTNSKISYAYVPPKSLKYVSMVARLQSFAVLEQLSQFLSPLRLPHRLTLTVAECGTANAFYMPTAWQIVMCYEMIEALERIGPKKGEASDFSYEEVVVGALVGVLLHESGHAVFDMLNVPVFGREEDAADEMSTFIALQFNEDVARTIVRGYAYMSKVWFASGTPLFSDEHGTGLQRYYNTLCIAYGRDPALFKEFIDRGDLPRRRASGCADEYQQVKLAFEKTVLPFVDKTMMQKVQASKWLQFSPNQSTLLKQQQQEQQPTFTFAICNESKATNVGTSLMVKLPEDPENWQVFGWFPLPNGGCSLIGSFYGDHLYYYAEGSNNTVWTAPETQQNATKQCIDHVNAFQHVAGAPCRAGQVMVNFRRIDIAPADSGITWHLIGGR